MQIQSNSSAAYWPPLRYSKVHHEPPPGWIWLPLYSWCHHSHPRKRYAPRHQEPRRWSRNNLGLAAQLEDPGLHLWPLQRPIHVPSWNLSTPHLPRTKVYREVFDRFTCRRSFHHPSSLDLVGPARWLHHPLSSRHLWLGQNLLRLHDASSRHLHFGHSNSPHCRTKPPTLYRCRYHLWPPKWRIWPHSLKFTLPVPAEKGTTRRFSAVPRGYGPSGAHALEGAVRYAYPFDCQHEATTLLPNSDFLSLPDHVSQYGPVRAQTLGLYIPDSIKEWLLSGAPRIYDRKDLELPGNRQIALLHPYALLLQRTHDPTIRDPPYRQASWKWQGTGCRCHGLP